MFLILVDPVTPAFDSWWCKKKMCTLKRDKDIDHNHFCNEDEEKIYCDSKKTVPDGLWSIWPTAVDSKDAVKTRIISCIIRCFEWVDRQ